MVLPEDFVINTDGHQPFLRALLESLPRQQQILERALGGTKYLARSVRALADDSGLTPEQVMEYCEASSHIARSPRVDNDGNPYYGYFVRLREKYPLSDEGELRHEINLDAVPAPGAEVFISFASQDEHLARELARLLKSKRVSTFLSAMDLKPGDRFSDKIRDALRDCRVVVLILTTRSKDRQWILFEAGAAWALQREIIPALNQVDESDIVLDPLRGIHAARIESSEQQREFARTLAKKLHPE